jgi:molybdenum cofactor guanylyltransferase
MSDVAAYVIAGGRSTRMGRDKAFLALDGVTLLHRAMAVARAVSPQVIIVGPREKFAGFGNVTEDLYPGQGPLAGIHAALSSSASELNLVIGVDTPFIDPRFAQYLVEQAGKSGAVVTVPVISSLLPISSFKSAQWSVAGVHPTENQEPNTEKREPETDNPTRNSKPETRESYQPLCAVYRREFATIAESALRGGRNAIVPLFAQVSTRQIREDEMQELAFDPRMFDNLNTPEEWDQACRRAQN